MCLFCLVVGNVSYTKGLREQWYLRTVVGSGVRGEDRRALRTLCGVDHKYIRTCIAMIRYAYPATMPDIGGQCVQETVSEKPSDDLQNAQIGSRIIGV